jgi:hypothetical protein
MTEWNVRLVNASLVAAVFCSGCKSRKNSNDLSTEKSVTKTDYMRIEKGEVATAIVAGLTSISKEWEENHIGYGIGDPKYIDVGCDREPSNVGYSTDYVCTIRTSINAGIDTKTNRALIISQGNKKDSFVLGLAVNLIAGETNNNYKSEIKGDITTNSLYQMNEDKSCTYQTFPTKCAAQLVEARVPQGIYAYN